MEIKQGYTYPLDKDSLPIEDVSLSIQLFMNDVVYYVFYSERSELR